jgi:hypothetical protein
VSHKKHLRQKATVYRVVKIVEIVLGLSDYHRPLHQLRAFIASGERPSPIFIGQFLKSFWPLENARDPAVLFCFHLFI